MNNLNKFVLASLLLFILFFFGCEDPIQVDSIPPNGNITEPLHLSYVSGLVSIRVEAFDNDGIASIDFRINGESVYIDLEEPYVYSWNTGAYAEDSQHIITAVITDDAGNTFRTQPIIVIVNNQDNESPTGFISSPLAGQIVQGIIDIVVEAQDNDSVVSVTFYINNETVFVDSNSPFIYTWDTSTASEDENNIIGAIITDASGNDTEIQSISVFVDNNEEPAVLAPYPPTSINVDVSNDYIYISWIKSISNNVHSYAIYKNDLYLASVDSTYTHYNDTDYSYNEEICYYLKAVTVSGIESISTQTACLTTPDNPNIYDLKIEIVRSVRNTYVQIYQNTTSEDDLIYQSQLLNSSDIVIVRDILPEGDNYIVRIKYRDDSTSPYTIFSVHSDILIHIDNYFEAPIVSEWLQ